MITGTLKSVAAASSEITVVRETGAELVLGLSQDSLVFADRTLTPLVDLENHIGREVEVTYGEEQELGRSGEDDLEDTAAIGIACGVLDMVGVLSGMFAVLTDSHDAMIAKATSETEIAIHGEPAPLAELARQLGKPLVVTFSPETGHATSITVD